MRKNRIKPLIHIAEQAGKRVLSIYNQPSFQVMNKKDGSVLTDADLTSHIFICDSLKKIHPAIPILSEESVKEHDYDIRKHWDYFFLVDPLDGTKEFIQRNGEFTINIALIRKDKPILGIIHAPVFGVTYYAEENQGAYKIANNQVAQLTPRTNTGNTIRVVTSRSSICSDTQKFLNGLASQHKEMTITTMGSALKFGLIADGSVDIYPRLGPTMEWDTASGQVIVSEVGKQVTVFGCDQRLKYNKIELFNPAFIVQ